MSIWAIITAVLQIGMLIYNKIKGLEVDKKDAFITDLNTALKEARDAKDPKSLSKLIDSL